MRWLLAAVGAAVFLMLWLSVRTEWSPWSPFDQYTVLPRRIAIALNAPAYLLAGLANALLGYSPYKGNVAQAFLYAMLPSVFFIWFLTGRWFDRRNGVLPRKAKHHSRLRLVGVGGLFAVQLLVLYRCFYFVAGGIEGWHGETAVNAAYTYGLAAWLAVWQWMALMSWRESRNQSRA